MGFYNEIFVEEEDGRLRHVGSFMGSDGPCYFDDDVHTAEEFARCVEDVKDDEENHFVAHDPDKRRFPWRTYKTSDTLIVLRRSRRRWYEFWKPTHGVWVSKAKYEVRGDHLCNFVPIDMWFGPGRRYTRDDLVTLELPDVPERR